MKHYRLSRLQRLLIKWVANCFPAYWATGARITYISENLQSVNIALPLKWRTSNHMRMIWGGSLYASLDPIYGVMLQLLLGRQYRVVDKEASIQFKHPGRTTLRASFHISDTEVNAIERVLGVEQKTTRKYIVELKDQFGKVHVYCEKLVHIERLY